jgi:hypothetical protein
MISIFKKTILMGETIMKTKSIAIAVLSILTFSFAQRASALSPQFDETFHALFGDKNEMSLCESVAGDRVLIDEKVSQIDFLLKELSQWKDEDTFLVQLAAVELLQPEDSRMTITTALSTAENISARENLVKGMGETQTVDHLNELQKQCLQIVYLSAMLSGKLDRDCTELVSGWADGFKYLRGQLLNGCAAK